MSKADLDEGITADFTEKLAFEIGLGRWVRMERNVNGRRASHLEDRHTQAISCKAGFS